MTVESNTSEAIAFLTRWPTPIIQLTAIHVDPTTHEKGLIESRSFVRDAGWEDAVRSWLEPRQGKANLYFTVNALKEPKDRKATKTDIKTMVALHVDIDVPPGEDQEGTAAKLVEAVSAYKLEPSVIISSGGGVQAFWFIAKSDWIDIDGDIPKAEAAECYNRALEADFTNVRGAKADACHNVDRIMRLPGTINVPDAKKLAKGRGPALARLIRFDDVAYPIGAYTPASSKNSLPATASGVGPSTVGAKGQRANVSINWDEVQRLLRTITSDQLRSRGVQEHGILSLLHGDNLLLLHDKHTAIGHRVAEGPYDSYSLITLSIATALLKGGLSMDEAAAVLSDARLPGNKHITGQKDENARRRAIVRALGKAQGDIIAQDKRLKADALGIPRWIDCYDDDGLVPIPTMRNARLSLESLGVVVRLDLFHDVAVIEYKGELEPLTALVGEYADAKLRVLRNAIIAKYDYDPQEKALYDAIYSIAVDHAFNPVRDYLNGCEGGWDGVPRVAKMASTLLGCADTEYNNGVWHRHMIAAVARARVPGCKYDCCPVMEDLEGTGKSTFLAILFGYDNFTDQKLLGVEEKMVAELLTGVWGAELADLAGMNRAEVESTKTLLSRFEDRCRKAYGRTLEKRKRTNVFTGTTNGEAYLQSQTGNRRFYPMKTGKIDLALIAELRDQLWGEAAAMFTAGEKWNLPEELWALAHEAQEERRAVHPWEETLANIPPMVKCHDGTGTQDIRIIYTHRSGTSDVMEERIANATVLQYVLDIGPGQAQPFHYTTLANALKRNGWQKPTGKGGALRVGKVSARGWWRPAPADAAPTPDKPATGTDPIPF